ncbi:MAG: BrnT family toxin [Acidobacteriota bacterium]
MHRPFQYRFEWDPIKAEHNARKHGITFERAATIFLDPEALSQFDEEHSRDEERWITIGLDRSAKGSARIRIFSARKATKNESKQHEERI